MLEITSMKNPLIREIQSLKTRKGRWAKGVYVIEGLKIVKEAIEHKGIVEKMIFSDDIFESPEVISLVSSMDSKIDLVKLSHSLFSKLSSMDSPQGVIALVRMQAYNACEINKSGKYLFLDGIQDPGNCGTIIRSTDAFDFDGVIFGPGCVDPYNPKSVQASMGSILRTPIYFSLHAADDLKALKSKGFSLASTASDGSIRLPDYEFTNKEIVAIGNEGKGISKEILELSNHRISIPMPGKAESLNAGVAASLIMYEASAKSRMSVEF